MGDQDILKLENLIFGKTDSVELTSCLTRETVIEMVNMILISASPGCWFSGEFINKENASYLVYDLHPCGSNTSVSSIRLLDFGDKLTLIRV